MNVPKYTTIGGVSLAAFLAVSMIVTPAFASAITDPNEPGVLNDDFDIKGAGIDDNGNPSIKVYGTAGGTSSGAGCGPAFAYLFFFNSGNNYAIASHDCFSDSGEGDGASDWHAHGFTAISAVAVGHDFCITSANDSGVASMQNHKATLLGTTESDLASVATVTIVGGAPAGDCPDVGIGAALYVDVIDGA